MRALNERIVALLIAACAAGCAAGSGTHPAVDCDARMRTGEAAALPAGVDIAPAAARPDSAGAADNDLIFNELHAYLLGELGALMRPGRFDARLAEVQSIIEAAEQFYLEGKASIAIGLLTEAEVLLRTKR